MEDTKAPPLLSKNFQISSFSELLNVVSTNDPHKVKSVILNIESLVKNTTKTSKKLTYNQLRNIFDIVKKEEFAENIYGFVLTLPKLAYIEARQEGEGKEMVNFIRELATSVDTPKQYKAFVEIMTAIVAYHKLHVKS